MAKSTLSFAAWFLKATILSPVYRGRRLDSRDGLAQPHQADLRAA
jgi:hypothetical protein